MSLWHAYRKARSIIDGLEASERQKLQGICEAISACEAALNARAAPLLSRCAVGCRGLCCRNIRIDTIITLLDLVFILCLDPNADAAIREGLEKEAFFTADCPFLTGGKGPCMFPPDVKPEKCLISFCEDTTPITPEIRALRRAFNRLHRFILVDALRRPLARWLPRAGR